MSLKNILKTNENILLGTSERKYSHSVEDICDEFLKNYDDASVEIPPQKLSHRSWRESEEVLRDISVRIVDTL